MKRSRIQLVQATLLKLAVEPVQDDRFAGRLPSNPFEYEKVALETAKSCKRYPEYWNNAEGAPEGIREHTYFVHLGLRTPLDDGDIGPYRFEVVYSGVIAVMPERKPGNVPENDLAAQFGLSLLYGVIREQLSTLTYKMPWGQVLLPTMNFLDEKFDEPEAIEQSSVAALELPSSAGT